MRTAAVLLLALTVSCRPAALRDPVIPDIDRFVNDLLQRLPEVPSVALSIVRDGKPYYTRVYGRSGGTAYYIGSTTKAYTGLACAVLAQRGQLDLDAPIGKYLPEVTGPAGEVTLRRYLTHTSEIDNDAITFRTAFSGEHTASLLMAVLSESKPGKPGFSYDNLGYVVASLVIERVTGKRWQDALDDLVFTPLGMNQTTAYMSEAARWRMATPYAITRTGEMAPLGFMKNDRMMHAAGGIVTTPDDVNRWLAANINQETLPRAAYGETHRQQVATKIDRGPFKGHGYGFGWYQAELNGEMVLFHGGGFEGWRSWFSFMPGSRIGVGTMFNASVPLSVSTLISAYAYDRILGKSDIEQIYAAELAKLDKQAEDAKARYIADAAKRAQRPWMLANPNASYTGRYENPLYGTLTIEERGDELWASIGGLSSVLEAFTEKESARVELIPGAGEVLRFGENAIMWRESRFERRP
jgi:CubicO group peptidase (beta-lactamase class C family)